MAPKYSISQKPHGKPKNSNYGRNGGKSTVMVGSIPTQWTSTYVLVDDKWLNKLPRPPDLVEHH
jgi:hypothetical protein